MCYCDGNAVQFICNCSGCRHFPITVRSFCGGRALDITFDLKSSSMHQFFNVRTKSFWLQNKCVHTLTVGKCARPNSVWQFGYRRTWFFVTRWKRGNCQMCAVSFLYFFLSFVFRPGRLIILVLCSSFKRLHIRFAQHSITRMYNWAHDK